MSEFVLDTPNTREQIFRSVHTTSLESHHREDLPRPPSFAATVLSRSALGLDGSTIMFSAVMAYGVIAVTPQELRRIALLAVAIRPLLWLVLFGHRREVEEMLLFSCQRSARGFKAGGGCLTSIPPRHITGGIFPAILTR